MDKIYNISIISFCDNKNNGKMQHKNEKRRKKRCKLTGESPGDPPPAYILAAMAGAGPVPGQENLQAAATDPGQSGSSESSFFDTAGCGR